MKSLAYKLGFEAASQRNRGYVTNDFPRGTKQAKEFSLGVEAFARKKERLKA